MIQKGVVEKLVINNMWMCQCESISNKIAGDCLKTAISSVLFYLTIK